MFRKLVWISTLAVAATALVAGAASAQYRGYGDGYAAAPDYYGDGPYGGPYGGGPYGSPRYQGQPYSEPDGGPQQRRFGRQRDQDERDQERDYGYGYDQGQGPGGYVEPYEGGRYPDHKASDYDLREGSQETTKTEIANPTKQGPGTIVIDTASRHLYYVEKNGQAIQYGIGVGRQGFAWKGTANIKRKAEWPDWIPPSDMLKRRPDLPERMAGGIENPLGARAMYLFQGNKDTMFRIHGTNEPDSIGKAMSSGCIRMMNNDVIDLYNRVPVGTKVVVL